MNKQTFVVNQAQAEELLAEWQRILRLQDWNIKIDIRRDREMELQSSMAEVHWTIEKKAAIMHLLDPIDYQNDYFPIDHEVSIVHELLHLHMAGFDAKFDTPEGVAQEQAINAISTALVFLKRRGVDNEPGRQV